MEITSSVVYTTSMAKEVKFHLEKGNKLCSSRRMKDIKQVSKILSKCKTILKDEPRKDTPLILAARLGLADMVWGFIECAKQPNFAFDGGLQSFLGEQNWYGNTALHAAATNNHVDVVNELLLNVSLEQLISCKNASDQTPLSRLGKPEYDQTIFDFLKRVTSTGMDHDAPTSSSSAIISIDDDEQEESRCYSDEKREYFPWPPSYEYDTRAPLGKLRNSIREVTSNKNTILHHVVTTRDIAYVKAIMEEHPALMYHRNLEGEIPAFIAAKEGHLDILGTMLSYFKRRHVDKKIESLMTRTVGDLSTALHMAIKNHHAGVVFWLIKEVPGLVDHVDKSRISPLYFAAQEGYAAMVKLILENCPRPVFFDPQVARGTALHAAACNGSVEIIRYLLNSYDRLLYVQNDREYTPLDEAMVERQLLAAKELLYRDRSIVYQIGHTRAKAISIVDIASEKYETLQFVISEFPGCIDVTDNAGWNILHMAIYSLNFQGIEYIFDQNSLTELINQKDNQGYTPIHYLVMCIRDFDEDIIKFLVDDRVDLNAVNNESQTPIDMVFPPEQRGKLLQDISKEKQKWKINKAYDSVESRKHFEMMDQIVIVVALTLTASFAAAFAVPGGFDGNQGSKQGMPILLNKIAYKLFVVANALAFICSCSVIIESIRTLIGRYATDGKYQEDLDRLAQRAFSMHVLTGMAMLTMAIAFIAGTYVILTPSLGFAISVCSICVLLFVCVLLFDVNLGGLVHKFWDMRQSRAVTGYKVYKTKHIKSHME